jgi:hypothetical protein
MGGAGGALGGERYAWSVIAARREGIYERVVAGVRAEARAA